MKPKYYSQYDAAWATMPYTIDGDKNETISYSGCGPTCAAMILSTWIDEKITPVETCNMAIELKDRTANNGTEWEYFSHIATKYGLKFNQTGNMSEVKTALQNGSYVVCSMGKGTFTKSGHFILIWGIDKNKFQVHDPASRSRSELTYSPDVFVKECKQYFIFSNPELTYAQALNICCKAIGYDEKYWSTKEKIDPCFPDFVKKLAKYLKGVK